VAHGGITGEVPITAREKELLHDVAAQLFHKFVFSGASLPKDSSLGVIIATNDPLVRADVISEGVLLNKNNHKILAEEPDRVSDWHIKLLEQNLLSCMTFSISRRQPDAAGKVRVEAFADGSFKEVDNRASVGAPFQTCRYRRPQMPDGRGGIHSVLIQGVWKHAVARFPSILKSTSPHDNAGLINNAISEMANENTHFRLIGFDGVGWEKFICTEAQRATHEHYDRLVQEFGYTRFFINAPVMDGSDETGQLLFSGEPTYRYGENWRYGTRSGLFTVAQVNQVGACAACIYMLEQALGVTFTLDELDHGNRVRLYSKGDDNMLLFAYTADADKFIKFKGTTMGITFDFEEYSDKNRGVYSAADYLAVQYQLTGNPQKPRAQYEKTGNTYLPKLLCSEGGMRYSAELDYWVRVSNRAKTMPPGFGYLARMADYASNPLALEHDELLRKGLKDILNLEWWEAFPTRPDDILLANELTDEQPTINAIEALLESSPEAIFKRRLNHDDLTEEELKRFYLYFSPGWLTQVVGKHFEVEERPPVVPRQHFTPHEVETAGSWLRERQLEYKQGKSVFYNPKNVKPGSPKPKGDPHGR
jgi:hypothetical protein